MSRKPKQYFSDNEEPNVRLDGSELLPAVHISSTCKFGKAAKDKAAEIHKARRIGVARAIFFLLCWLYLRLDKSPSSSESRRRVLLIRKPAMSAHN